ncbi:MAG: hypothetical protein V8K32_01965 [Candidatus Electrothrix gigas]
MKFSIVDGERVMPFPKGFSRYVVMKLLSVVAKKIWHWAHRPGK